MSGGGFRPAQARKERRQGPVSVDSRHPSEASSCPETGPHMAVCAAFRGSVRHDAGPARGAQASGAALNPVRPMLS